MGASTLLLLVAGYVQSAVSRILAVRANRER